MTSTFEEVNFPIRLTFGSSAQTQTVTNNLRLPSTSGTTTNTRYYVSQSLVNDKIDLTFNFKLLWSYYPQDSQYASPRPTKPTSIKVYYQLIRLRNGSETIIHDNPNGSELVYFGTQTTTTTLFDSVTSFFGLFKQSPSFPGSVTSQVPILPFYSPVASSFTVLSTDLKKDDIFYLKAKAIIQGKNGTQYMYIEAGSELNIIQNPISNQTINIGNFWISASTSTYTSSPVTTPTINSGGFAGTNILYTTSSVFKNNFDNKFAWGKDIPSSGFNTIETHWDIIPGDEFKFEGKENQRYRVLKAGIVSCSGYISSSVLAVEFDRPLPTSGSLNYDKFSIQRYIDFEGNLIFEGFRPTDNGPFIITPEFITPNLNKNIGKILEDLTQKGLLT